VDRWEGQAGGDAGRQCLAAGLVDEPHIHLVPALLGRGVRLFEHPGTEPHGTGPHGTRPHRTGPRGWAAPEVTQSPHVTRPRYRRLPV
jgi:hypothetical protein